MIGGGGRWFELRGFSVSVAEYAAAEARYIAQCDVGYSQPDRWTWYDNCDWDGWLLKSPQNADCSAFVAGCYNIAAHHEWGEPFTAGYFPRSTWTGSIREECAKRNFADISGSWTGNVPDGGWYTGDIVLSEAASGGRGHVAIIINGGSGESSDGALLAEAWIAEDGSIDGYLGDQTGSEVRIVEYASHPYTQSASWTHALRRRDVQSPLTGGGGVAAQASASAPAAESSSAASGYELSEVQKAVLRAADNVGCPWWAALAVLWMETGERGANIFGHDAGGAYCGGGEVTEEKFRDFYSLIENGATSNGVGPLQVTYPGYFFNDPGRAWWDPEKSAEVGCTILRDLINAEGDSYEDLRRVGSRYNSGSAYGAYDAYGVPFSDRCRSWYDYGRPGMASDGLEFLSMSQGIDLLSEINARLIEISDQTGAGIAGRRFDGPLVGWLKQIDGHISEIEAKVDALKPAAAAEKPAEQA